MLTSIFSLVRVRPVSMKVEAYIKVLSFTQSSYSVDGCNKKLHIYFFNTLSAYTNKIKVLGD